MEIEALCVAHAPVAICLNLVGKNVRHCYLSAYDNRYSDASVGTLIHQHAIQSSVDDGFSAYSFLGHPTPFKKMWANDTVTLLCYRKAITRRGRIWLIGWMMMLRPMVKKLLRQLPTILSYAPVRRIINTLRSVLSLGRYR